MDDRVTTTTQSSFGGFKPNRKAQAQALKKKEVDTVPESKESPQEKKREAKLNIT